MKRFPKILAATCAAVVLSASLALAAEAAKANTPNSAAAQTQCPVSGSARMGMNAAAMPRMHSAMWSDATDGTDHKGTGHGGGGHGYSGQMNRGHMGAGMANGTGQMAMMDRNF